MLEGVDSPSQEWLRECDLTFEALLELPAGERALFIIAPLTAGNPAEIAKRVKKNAEDTLADMTRSQRRPATRRHLPDMAGQSPSDSGQHSPSLRTEAGRHSRPPMDHKPPVDTGITVE